MSFYENEKEVYLCSNVAHTGTSAQKNCMESTPLGAAGVIGLVDGAAIWTVLICGGNYDRLPRTLRGLKNILVNV